jgi:hypothetical protein
VYGAAIYTERGSRASRWASRTCYNYGFEYETQINPNIDGFVNLRALLKAFSLYKDQRRGHASRFVELVWVRILTPIGPVRLRCR